MVNGRILRIELRRSIAVWAGTVFLLAALAFLFGLTGPWTAYGERWTAQWSAAALWERHLLLFLLPLVVGAGALQGLRDRRAGTGELLAATPRPAWQRAAATAGALAIALVAAYLLVYGVGAVQVAAGGGVFHLGWAPVVAVGALSLVAAGWLGLGVARALPSVLTPPALAIATLLAMFPVVGLWQEEVVPKVAYLAPALDNARSLVHDLSGQVSLAQAVWLLGVAATGFWLLAATRPWARPAALLPAVLGAAVALPLLPSGSEPVYVVNAAAEPVCSGRVCVTRAHEDLLPVVAGPGEEALRLLARLPGPPRQVRESAERDAVHHPPARDAGIVYVDFDVRDARSTGEKLTRHLLAGAGTPSCHSLRGDDFDGRLREEAARRMAAGWLMGDVAAPTADPVFQELNALVEQAWPELRAVPEREQGARVAALREAALSCDGDLLAILTDGRR
ncbi:hypothetical protein [Nonomuraea sp. NPDC023979]|uniref:hypothetical protein n=1 Tax=Nonomuraea sp. NPDC023979 TaxID=3154796 RepID=UPI0033D89B64